MTPKPLRFQFIPFSIFNGALVEPKTCASANAQRFLENDIKQVLENNLEFCVDTTNHNGNKERRFVMIYAEIESQEEQKRLNDAMMASEKKSWYRRLHVISLSAQRYTVQKLGEMFQLCEETIRNYIHAYNQGGLDRLKPVKQTGRPPKIGHWTKEQWDKVLEQTPNQYEKLNTQSRQWTLELLCLYLKEYHQIQVSVASVYNSLRKTGRRTGRSKLRVGSPDPDYKVKRKHIEELRDFH
jgi:transposase